MTEDEAINFLNTCQPLAQKLIANDDIHQLSPEEIEFIKKVEQVNQICFSPNPSLMTESNLTLAELAVLLGAATHVQSIHSSSQSLPAQSRKLHELD